MHNVCGRRGHYLGADHDVHTAHALSLYGLHCYSTPARHRLQQRDHTGRSSAPKCDIRADVEGRRGVCARLTF